MHTYVKKEWGESMRPEGAADFHQQSPHGKRVALLASTTVFMLLFAFADCLLERTALGEEVWPLILETGFSGGSELWKTTDPTAWRLEAAEQPGDALFRLIKQSNYSPPFRSPINIALLRYLPLTDVDMTVSLRSTSRDYDHRSLCLFFGWQDPAHFYYAHFGKKADDHANQIFIVNGAERTKISLKSTSGTPWTNEWHTARILRHAEQGTIQVYFDDMTTPVMEAKDKTFTWGQLGFGSFDDPGDFRSVLIRGHLKPEVPNP